MKRIKIDEALFQMALVQDTDYMPYRQYSYLDLDTGEIIWVFDNDDEAYMETGMKPSENATIREMITKSPTKYLKIPGQTHGDHHDILNEFLDSNWTDDEGLWEHTLISYTGSIGRWKKAVNNQEIIYAFEEFRWNKIKEIGESFLNENGIIPVWK